MWFKMLRDRDYGISDVRRMRSTVTPIQEYGISVPMPVPSQ
jgi:hypothetical protein